MFILQIHIQRDTNVSLLFNMLLKHTLCAFVNVKLIINMLIKKTNTKISLELDSHIRIIEFLEGKIHKKIGLD